MRAVQMIRNCRFNKQKKSLYFLQSQVTNETYTRMGL